MRVTTLIRLSALLRDIWASGESALQRKQRRQNMLDHIILTVSDFERSVAFYAKALKPLGITNFTDYEGQDGHPDLKGFGDGKRVFSGSKKESPIPKRCMLDL
jgi:predicted enzyme related to lactoylglutathione lyase